MIAPTRLRAAVRAGNIALIVAFCLVADASRSAAQEATRDEMTHEYIFQFPGIAKQDIYTRTMNWIVNNLRWSGAVVETDDPASGTIVANGRTTMTAEGDSSATGVSFRMSVDVREGKERVRFLNLQSQFAPGGGWDDAPTDTAWHRGARRKFDQMVRMLGEYVKMKF